MKIPMKQNKNSALGRIIVLGVLLLIVLVMAFFAVRSCVGPSDPDAPDEPRPAQTAKPNRKNKAEPTPEPTPTPMPTPTPVPGFAPRAVEGTRPSDFGLETALQVDGQDVGSYARTGADRIDFLEGHTYTDMEGIITFRGNNFRDTASYGTISISQKILEPIWSIQTGSMPKVYQSGAGGGSWTGSGWTGQPLIVRWPEATKNIMNMYDSAKAKKDLVEVIYATMDGKIYFLDLETGEKTRDCINIGWPFKGAGALDPRGYPLLYVGSGDDSPQHGLARAFIISLIDGEVLHTFGNNDSFSQRGELSYFDSSALVDAETDTLIYPGENGILYTIKLNTKYDEAAGTISIDPTPTVKWRFKGARSMVNNEYWLGVEDSAILWRDHAIFSDNGGHLVCLDVNTYETKWVQDTLDDTNCTPVLELEGDDHHPYVYTSTSFHAGWRAEEDQLAPIPIWKIDALTGEIVWETTYDCGTMSGVSGGVQGTLVVGKNNLSDLIFVPVAYTPSGTRGKLVALDKATGDIVWEYQFQKYPWSSPVAVYTEAGDGYLIQCNQSGYMHLLDGRTGELLHEISLESNIEASPAVFGNTIVVGTRGSKIYGVTIK